MFLGATFLTACYAVAIRGDPSRPHRRFSCGPAWCGCFSAPLYPIYLAFVRNALFSVPLPDLVFQALYQGVLTAAISLALYGQAIRLLAANAAAFVALGPITAALMAILVLAEWPSTTARIAILIVAGGIYLASGAPLATRALPPSAQIR
jgi:drug/metabolite transporter (DMT)-like permease